MRSLCLSKGSVLRYAGLAGMATVLCMPIRGQTVMSPSGGPVRLFGTDLAVFEIREPRRDLPCEINPTVKAQVGFDLKFHAGYEVVVPLKDLAGRENLLTIVFRVTPLDAPESETYFTQKIRVPEIEEDAKGEAALYGSFDLGEGKYKVDWLMRDRAERVCSNFWDVEAGLQDKDAEMAMVIPPRSIRTTEIEQFRDEPPIERLNQDEPINVKVLLNYSPQSLRSSTMRPIDTSALISILRSICREPKLTKFTLVAFSMANQQVLYRQDQVDRIDFPALGDAVNKLKLGTVDFNVLAEKDSSTRFLTELIRSEMGGPQKPDAIIFAGPKVMLEHHVETESLREVGVLDFPVFYMNYNLFPNQVPWKDSISHAVKFFKGQEYTISKPRDLWFATSEVVNRIVKTRTTRVAQNASTQ